MIANAKFTWKSIMGLLATLAGSLSAANVAGMGLPTSVSKWLIAGGIALVGIDRLADVVDNAVRHWWASLPPQDRTELEHVVHSGEIEKLTADARHELDLLLVRLRTELARLENTKAPIVVPNGPGVVPVADQLANAGLDQPVVLAHPLAKTRPNPAPPTPTRQ